MADYCIDEMKPVVVEAINNLDVPYLVLSDVVYRETPYILKIEFVTTASYLGYEDIIHKRNDIFFNRFSKKKDLKLVILNKIFDSLKVSFERKIKQINTSMKRQVLKEVEHDRKVDLLATLERMHASVVSKLQEEVEESE